MKAKLLIFLFLMGFTLPNFLFAQFTQQGTKLVGTGTIGLAYQGFSVAISSDGNTAVVGGWGDNKNTGAVWVFIRRGGVWTQQGTKLVGIGSVGEACIGISVAISSDGNTAIVGGPHDSNDSGAIWVFVRNNGNWTQQGQKLVGTGAVGNALQGSSVSISSDGNTAILGGQKDNNYKGAIWVFTRSGGVWTQQGQKLIGTGTVGNAWQGTSVAISADGNTIIEGGPQDYPSQNIGAVWVFIKNDGIWAQQGPKLIGTGEGGYSNEGVSVAISSDGNTSIIGGWHYNSWAGAVWIFIRNDGVWTQEGPNLVGTGAVGNAYQGSSVCISSDGNTAIEGGIYDNTGEGAFWVFFRSNGVWTQQGSKLVGANAVGNLVYQGISVAISSDGNTAIVGGHGDNSLTGAVWVFTKPIIGIKPISNEIPNGFSLSQNYPNPFNPSTNIGFRIAHFGLVKITIFDVLGREVSTLVNEQLKPGTYEVNFDGTNLPSGVYFYKIEAGNYSETRKMILVK